MDNTISAKYSCEYCQYQTERKSQYTRHLSTNRHKRQIPPASILPTNKRIYTCGCGKDYKYRTALVNHEKRCIHVVNKQQVEAKALYELVLQSIAKTTEVKEKVDELAANAALTNSMVVHNHTQNTVIQNNPTNNYINFNVFLNDYCKDAMTIGDFMKTIQPSIEDIMYMTQHGNKEGIYNILKNALSGLQITERPLHCTDVKRHSTYVKEEDGWIVDKEQAHLKRLCGETDHVCVKKVVEIIRENPKYQECGTKEYEEGIRMMMETTGGRSGTSDTHITLAKSIEELVYVDKAQLQM
jgi:hypothetical protein